MPEKEQYLGQLRLVEQRFRDFVNDATLQEAEDVRIAEGIFIDLLRDVCSVVRNAESAEIEGLDEIISKASAISSEAVEFAYGDANIFDYMPSFAHDVSAPLVRDTLKTIFGQGMMDVIIPALREFRNPVAVIPPIPGPGPWHKSQQPHPNSSRLARFRLDIVSSATDATPRAMIIHQARCEIKDNLIPVPYMLRISSGASCLALTGGGGWKNRDPVLNYYLLNDDTDIPLSKREISLDPGLSDVAYIIETDETRRLMFIADHHRVKSFSWGNAKENFQRAPRVHTLASGASDGPLAVLPTGQILRAGTGLAMVWDIDGLEVHTANGARIGGEFTVTDSWREADSPKIERSVGSAPHRTITFDPTLAGGEFTPMSWHVHPSTGHILASERGEKAQRYECVRLDLEHGGKVVGRYLGHGGDVESFSTSVGDPNVFATAGGDGFARLFDVRQSLPVVTFDTGKQMETCPDVVLVHPDGVPTLFSGGEISQQIKMWDIRAKAAVYELSTGNNAVMSMAWDERRSILYAATECDYIDRLGYAHDYRKAKVPARPVEDGEDIDDDEDESGEYDGDEEYEGKCWPKKAFHGEDFFGRMFDAGEHRLYSYAFKAEADVKQVPAYGQATMGARMGL